MGTEPFEWKAIDSVHSSSLLPRFPIGGANRLGVKVPSQLAARNGRRGSRRQDDCCPAHAGISSAEADSSYDSMETRLSPWSSSAVRRILDCALVLLALPLVAPLCLAIAAAVRLTSHGPALFLQERMGRYGQAFTILKFRTMVHLADNAHHPVTTADNQRFTPIGRFLRRWKFDELPQLLNVLLGQMSLVGPRPLMPEHAISRLSCRPGITGLATMVFADEETVLARVPSDQLDVFFHAVVLPAKLQLDAQYMARATFLSDLQLLAKSVLRRWDNAALEALVSMPQAAGQRGKSSFQGLEAAPGPVAARANEVVQPEQVSAF